jgi:hypothetical protein
MLDGESADFGEQIAAVFRDAGWEILPPNRVSLLDLPGFVTLITSDPALVDLHDFVAASLNSVDIPCRFVDHIDTGQLAGPFQRNAIYVVVGRKL